MTTVSIITTSFNAAKTIRATIESILSQKGSFELEYIITDAGSKDETINIIKSFPETKITLLSLPGYNQSAGINAGLKAAKGDILAFLNADDVYEDGALEKVVKAFENNPDKKWLIGQCKIIDESGQEMQSWITSYKNLLLKNYAYSSLLIENYICQPATFFHKDLLKQYGYFAEDQHLAMDYEFWLRVGKTEKPIILSDYLAGFRRFAGTKSNSGYLKQFDDDRKIAKKYALETGRLWTIPLKYLSYLKTIGIYRLIYR